MWLKALTAYNYPGYWIHFNAALTYSAQFPLPGEHSMPKAAYETLLIVALANSNIGRILPGLDLYTWVKKQQLTALLKEKDKNAWRWWDSNLGSRRESRVNTPIQWNLVIKRSDITKPSYNKVILLVPALYISSFFDPDIMRNLI